jgi:hypothetical protein
MCAAHTGCEYFLFGKVGTSWENECWMEKTAGMKPGNTECFEGYKAADYDFYWMGPGYKNTFEKLADTSCTACNNFEARGAVTWLTLSQGSCPGNSYRVRAPQ